MIKGYQDRWAVVTGASSGLGRCYALELARRGVDCVLVSLPDSGLDDVADEVRGLGVNCVTIEADITDRDAVIALCRRIAGTFDVFMLVNNAGTGGTRRFTDCSLEYIENIIRLNVMACTLMTHELVPVIIRGGGGFVLNVSSMASFSPIGFKTVYPASKRFVMDFSRSLRQELSGTGVKVSTVHPGAMRTNSEVTRRIEMQGLAGGFPNSRPSSLLSASCATFAGHAMIIPGLRNKLNFMLMKIIPSWIRLPLMSAVVSREITAGLR